jgi:hypothetical protein
MVPDDVLFEILNCFRIDGFEFELYSERRAARSSLNALSQTCKRLNPLANQVLYRNVDAIRRNRHQSILEFIRRNPYITKYIRYYRCSYSELKCLGTLLSHPLHLYLLEIINTPAIPSDSAQSSDWPSKHEDLVVEEIRLGIDPVGPPYDIGHTWLLSHLHTFKGLKSLFLHFHTLANHVIDLAYDDPERPSFHLLLSSCPELEHLILESIDNVRLIDVDAFPKLKSVRLKLRGIGYGRIETTSFKELWDALTILKNKKILSFVDCQGDSTGGRQPLLLSQLYRESLAYVESRGIDPRPVIRWLTHSNFAFAESSSSSPDPIQIDLRLLRPFHRVQTVLEAIKSMDPLDHPNCVISLRIQIEDDDHRDLINSMPTNIRRLSITFRGGRSIPSSVTTRILSALPRLHQLHIAVYVHSNFEIDGQSYVKFTDSPFDSLIPPDHHRRLRLTILRNGQVDTVRPLTGSQLENSSAFFTELFRYFHVNFTLEELELEIIPSVEAS